MDIFFKNLGITMEKVHLPRLSLVLEQNVVIDDLTCMGIFEAAGSIDLGRNQICLLVSPVCWQLWTGR